MMFGNCAMENSIKRTFWERLYVFQHRAQHSRYQRWIVKVVMKSPQMNVEQNMDGE